MKLHGYQEKAVEWIATKKRCGLFLEMGLGKTLSVLSWAQRNGYEGGVLVIAPKRVAELAWPAEVSKWGLGAKVCVVAGGKAEREAKMRQKADLHVLGRDNLVWYVKWLIETKQKWPFKAVVVDESSGFKDQGSQRWKALKAVRKKCEVMVLLTGTPAPNSLLELWPQVFLLDDGERLGRSFTAYRNCYFESDYMGWKWTLKKGAEEEIWAKLSDICLSMKAEDWLELPDRVDVKVEVDLGSVAMAKYEQMEKDFIIRAIDDAGGDITAVNAAVLVGKLLQLANGFAYTVEKDAVVFDDSKLDALEEIVESASGVLVAYTFKADLARITERLKRMKVRYAVVTEPGAVKKWDNAELDVLLAHPKSAGHGLNLQHGGNVVVWFGLTHSLEDYQQFNARLHRQGQKKAVIIHHLITKNTVDEEVVEALRHKQAVQDRLMTALKARAESWEQRLIST